MLSWRLLSLSVTFAQHSNVFVFIFIACQKKLFLQTKIVMKKIAMKVAATYEIKLQNYICREYVIP